MTPQGGGQTSNWEINFNPGSTWPSGHPITITAPTGTVFPSAVGAYNVEDASTASDCNGTCSGLQVGPNGNTVTIDAPGQPNSTSDDYRVYITGVTNPPAGSYPGSAFCVDDGSSGCLSGNVILSGVELSLGASEAHAGDQVSVTGAVYGTSGALAGTTVTFSDGGAGGSFAPASTTTDSGGGFATVYTAGPQGGAAALTATAAAASPSSAAKTLTVLTMVSGVGISVSPLFGNDTNAQWTAQFTTTSALAQNAGTISIAAPSGTTFPSAATAYQVDGVVASQVSASGADATITVPQSVYGGTQVSVVVSGVTNPGIGTYAASRVSVATSSDVVPTSPSAGLTFTSGPASTLALGTAVTGPVGSTANLGPIVATVEDAYGNLVAQAGNITVNLSSDSTTGEFSATAGGGETTSLTIPAGQSSAPFYYGDTTAGSWTVVARATGLAAATLSVTTQPGPPGKLGFVQEPGAAVATNAFGVQPWLAVEDAFGNIITSTSALSPYRAITMAITPGTGAKAAALGGDFNENLNPFYPGEVVFTSLAIDTAGMGYTLTATDNGLAATSDPFNVAEAPSAVSVSFGAASVTAGGQISVTGEVTDASGQGVPGVGVDLSDNGAGGTFAASGYVQTGPDGSYATTYTAPTLRGTVSITAQLATSSPHQSSPLTVTAGPPDPGYSAISGPSHPVTAGNANLTLTTSVEDSHQNAVTGLVASDFSVVSSDPKVGTLTPLGVAETTPGTYSIVVSDTDADGGNAQNITVVVEGVALNPTGATVAPAAPDQVTLAALPSVAATGASVTLKGTVLDAFGNPVTGVGVTLSDGASGGSFGSTNLATLADGSFSTSYTAPSSTGTVNLTATTTSLIEGHASLSVKADAASPSASTVAGPSSVTAGSGDVTLQVGVVDQHGNTYTGLQENDFVVTSSDPSVGTLTPVSVTETSPGTYAVVVTDEGADAGATQTLTLQVDGVVLTQTAALVVSPAQLASLAVTAPSPWAESAQSVTLTVRTLDAFSNPIPNLPFDLSYVAADGSTIQQSSVQTGSGGTYSASFQVPATTTSVLVVATTASPAVTGSYVLFVPPAGSDVTHAAGLEVTSGTQTLDLASNGVTLTKVTVTGITGALTAAQYGSAPDPVAGAFASATGYVDVQLADATLTSGASLTIAQCSGASSSQTLYWWSGSVWSQVSPAPTYDPGTGCLSVTLTSATSPSLAALTGTPFAVAAAPPVSVSGGGGGGGDATTGPSVQDVSPAAGPAAGGTTVRITGSGFSGATGVEFGSTPATSFTVDSESEITAVSPAGQGTVDVSVTGPAGTSHVATADRFSYTPPAATTFSDVAANEWAYGAIQQLVTAGVTVGFPDGTFRPGAPVTRAQFVKMLVLALGQKPAASGQTAFADVPTDDWYAPFVARAASLGIVEGVTSSSFAPNATITREAMAAILARALKLTKTTSLTFTDAGRIAAWVRIYVAQVVAGGYMKGYADGTFRPLSAVTRAEAAAVLAKVLDAPSH